MKINEQYEMLKRCSQNKNLSEWNTWREENPGKDINLSGYNFEGFFLDGANFSKVSVRYASRNVSISYTGEVHLERANFDSANLENTCFGNAILKKSKFWHAKATGADFNRADLEEADLSVANLNKCDFSDASLKNASIISSHLEGAKFTNAILVGCQVRASVCDNATNFYGIKINKYSKKCMFTDFTATSLGNVRIDSGSRQLLEYNIRRANWENWYKTHKISRCSVQLFWSISNYGTSTLRIIVWFFGLALLFVAIYLNLSYWWNIQAIGGSGEGFAVEPHLPLWHYAVLIILRPIYFSIVTMTTLGFGDMFANARSIWGHILLTVQVILGYVLLGALVTRLAILFTSDGPAGEFEKDKK